MNQAINPRLYRKAAPNSARTCPVAAIGEELERLLPKKNAAEQASLDTYPLGRLSPEHVAADRKHDMIQNRALALEEQLTWGPAESLEGAAYAVAVAFNRLCLIKGDVAPEDRRHVEAIERALWSARHGLEQATGRALSREVSCFLMSGRLDPFADLADEVVKRAADG
jgi:hypothetical protein